ncbi:hypothetical protein MP228_009029 [Amoeboaphelidium protococcarum]|nr:hypothetical protein MP228_009029 [Amoeboaphelidium protococcarum]
MLDTRVAFDIGSKQQHESNQIKPLMEFIKPMSRLRDLEGSGSIFHFPQDQQYCCCKKGLFAQGVMVNGHYARNASRFSSSCIGHNRGDQNGGWKVLKLVNRKGLQSLAYSPYWDIGLVLRTIWNGFVILQNTPLTDVISQQIISLRYPGDGDTRLVDQ